MHREDTETRLRSAGARIIAAMILPVLLAGCIRETGGEGFVARVGSSLLTRDELLRTSGSASDTSAASLRYINEWVSGELLYQEALRRGLDRSERVQEQIDAVQKRITVEALLDEVLFEDSSDIGDEEVREYFAAHGDEFMLAEDVALISYARFDERSSANRFRSQIVRGQTWEQALEDLQNDTLLVPHLLQVTDHQYVTRSTLYPEELWRVARTLNPSKVSFVVATDHGSYVLFLHDFRKQGTAPDLPYVAPEIRGRLVIRKRKQRYDALLDDLRSRFPVEVRTASHPETPTEGGTE